MVIPSLSVHVLCDTEFNRTQGKAGAGLISIEMCSFEVFSAAVIENIDVYIDFT